MAHTLAKRHDMMDMGSGTGGSSAMSMGVFHTSTGDPLWFSGWTPATPGAVFGACFGLFLLAGLGRLLLAVFFQLNLALRVRSTDALEREYSRLLSPREANIARSPTSSSGTNSDNSATNEKRAEIVARAKRRAATAPPMMLSHDVPRAILVTAIAAISYFLMLAVMTGSLYYFVAILLGIFAGEVAFGRYGGMAGH